MEKRICPKCANEVPESARFCIYCGTPQPEEAPVPEEVSAPEAVKEAPVPEEVTAPEAVEKAPVPEEMTAPEAVEKAPVPEEVTAPEAVEEAPVPEKVTAPEAVEKAPVPEEVTAPEAVEEAPVPEEVTAPEAVEEAPVPEEVTAPEAVEEAPVPEKVTAPEAVKEAPVPKPVKAPETIKKAPAPEPARTPMPEYKGADYSYTPQDYKVENGDSQGAGALVVFILVAAMIVVCLVVGVIMGASALSNKISREKKLSSSSESSYSYAERDDEESGEFSGDAGDNDDEDKKYGVSGFLDDWFIWYDGSQEPMDGYFQSGDYKVGEDIPAGTYYIRANTYKFDSGINSLAYRNISTDPEGDDALINGWFNYSTYVELKEGTYFHMSHCGAFDVSKCPVENDPFEHPGTFMVGLDVEPGSYELVLVNGGDHADYAVYEKAEDIGIPLWLSGSKALYGGGAYGGEVVTLEEGQFIELSNAVLTEHFETAADGSDDGGEVIDGTE